MGTLRTDQQEYLVFRQVFSGTGEENELLDQAHLSLDARVVTVLPTCSTKQQMGAFLSYPAFSTFLTSTYCFTQF